METAANKSARSGFTLIEVIIVLTIMVGMYAVIAPQIGKLTKSNVPETLGRISADVRAAFDMAVLNGKYYRLAFDFRNQSYWLEVMEGDQFFLPQTDREPSQFAEFKGKDAEAAFDDWFNRYVELAGEEYKDVENETVSPPNSPLVMAKERLKNLEMPRWTMVDNVEWSKRSIEPQLVFSGIQTEHDAEYFSSDNLGDSQMAYIYFFPTGYVERAYLHIAMDNGEGKADPNEKPYTLRTIPYNGVGIIESGKQDYKSEEES